MYERVIECHSSASKSPWHDYISHELKKGLRFLTLSDIKKRLWARKPSYPSRNKNIRKRGSTNAIGLAGGRNWLFFAVVICGMRA